MGPWTLSRVWNFFEGDQNSCAWHFFKGSCIVSAIEGGQKWAYLVSSDTWMNGSTSDGYGDSWVQRQLGTGTVGYSDRRVQMRQLGTGTIGHRDMRQSGTGTIGYKSRRQSGTGTNGYKWCDKRVQRQTGTSATNGYSDKRVQKM